MSSTPLGRFGRRRHAGTEARWRLRVGPPVIDNIETLVKCPNPQLGLNDQKNRCVGRYCGGDAAASILNLNGRGPAVHHTRTNRSCFTRRQKNTKISFTIISAGRRRFDLEMTSDAWSRNKPAFRAKTVILTADLTARFISGWINSRAGAGDPPHFLLPGVCANCSA